MKKESTLRTVFNGENVTFEFQYRPSYPGDRENPPEAAELNIISATKDDGTKIEIPDVDLKPEEYTVMENHLFEEIGKARDHPEA
jgi:hypothetical protein